jgi:alkyl sulfatase BDS1-like metallo-beta-lactamase superfamily hydrolase
MHTPFLRRNTLSCLMAAVLMTPVAFAQAGLAPTKGATAATQAANKKVQESLPFSDRKDFENAQKGFIATPKTLTIKNTAGNVIWDLEAYKTYIGLDKPAPDTVNPSLWRNAQLSMLNGLFEVTDGIYQVRGYDLSNITLSGPKPAGSCSTR